MRDFKNDENFIEATKTWIQKAVIGLNLCPFAKFTYNQNTIRYVLSRATSEQLLSDELLNELKVLQNADVFAIETTLIIHPFVFQDFLDQNDYLDVVDEILDNNGLVGIFQIANFHPNFQFADRKSEHITNYVNRSPFPTLHLLREESVEHAILSHPNIDTIYQTNKMTMKKLGIDGFRNLFNEHFES
ncbi:DUF1415 domain-containing protein [Leptospira sp. 96542]|nr:DUF1415 domain-containing protein [Leptospira sp. 96542]